MAEGRMLKKKISLDAAWADLENDTHRMLYETGIAHLDIEGRISGEPREFKAAVVPMLEHITKEKILKFFKDAEKVGLIIRYSVNRKWVVQYPGFKKNQSLRPDKEAPSQYPSPPEDYGSGPGVVPELDGITPAEVKGSEEKLNTPLNPPKGGNGTDEDFETWWDAYPPTQRKTGKPRVLEKWRQLRKAQKLLPIDQMLMVLEVQKKSRDWIKSGGEFIPGPKPYLNQLKFMTDGTNLQPQDEMDIYMKTLETKTKAELEDIPL